MIQRRLVRVQPPPGWAVGGRPAAADVGTHIQFLESALWQHPEWWSIALSVTAWVVLAARGFESLHGHYTPDTAPPDAIGAWILETAGWLLMVVAMMVPLVLFSIRVTAARSLWRRRHRAIGGFLLGYISPWLIVGACLAALDVALGLERWRHATPWLGGTGFVVAAVWQLAPLRRRAVLACHRTVPLAPRGWPADRDCLRFGWLTGRHCVLSCWALMVACVLAGHSLTAMVCAAAVGLAERYFFNRPGPRRLFGPLLAVAVVYGILGLANSIV